MWRNHGQTFAYLMQIINRPIHEIRKHPKSKKYGKKNYTKANHNQIATKASWRWSETKQHNEPLI